MAIWLLVWGSGVELSGGHSGALPSVPCSLPLVHSSPILRCVVSACGGLVLSFVIQPRPLRDSPMGQGQRESHLWGSKNILDDSLCRENVVVDNVGSGVRAGFRF